MAHDIEKNNPVFRRGTLRSNRERSKQSSGVCTVQQSLPTVTPQQASACLVQRLVALLAALLHHTGRLLPRCWV